AFVLLVRLLFGGRFSDLCYGYMAFWKRVLPSLDLDSNGFEIETQLSIQALRAGLKIVEVPSFEHRRIHGKSNLRTLPDGWRVLNARTTGIDRADRGDVIAFLDDDAVAEPDWLETMLRAYGDGSVMAVGGRIEPLWAAGRPGWFPPEFDWVVGCTYVGLPEHA